MATPQDKIFKALEDIEDKQLANYIRVELALLKAELSDAEDRIAEMKERLSEMGIKLYGGKRN